MSLNRDPTTGLIVDSGKAVSSIYMQSAANSSHIVFLTSTVNNQNAYERMRIAPNGNIGIGTTSPSQKLEVVGTALAQNLTLYSQPATTFEIGNSAPNYSINQTMGVNDFWKIYGEGLSNTGKLVFEVGDDGNWFSRVAFRGTSFGKHKTIKIRFC